MHRVPAVAGAASALFLLSLVTTGCSGSAGSASPGRAKPRATSSPDPAPDGDFPLSSELSSQTKTNPGCRAARDVCDPGPPGVTDLSAGG